jgi:uncharacterized protein
MGMEKITEVTDDHCEKLMADQGYIRESVVRGEQSAVGAGKCCAYNQTRERFLCSSVDSGDFHASGLDMHLAALAPGSATALWLVPFRGISPTSVRVPIDLLYLDRNCMVIDAVESFPIASVSPSSAPAASVLALPANTIAAAGTRAGDQLILCDAEEMKWRLQQLLAAKAQSQTEATTALSEESVARGTVGRVLPFDRSRPKPVEIPPAGAAPIELPEAPALAAAPAPALAEPAQKKPAKSWLQRLLSPDPPQPRKAQRESLEGIAAYFFTGGESKAHGVRDISPTGFYIYTEERWYPGTIIRMTLTDQRQPTAERSITVNAAVVRWGNDGVGLQFVLQDEKSRSRASSDGMMAGPSRAHVEQFIARLRSAAK